MCMLMLIYFIFLIFTIETKNKKIRCPNRNVPFPYSPIQKFVNFGKPSSFPPSVPGRYMFMVPYDEEENLKKILFANEKKD